MTLSYVMFHGLSTCADADHPSTVQWYNAMWCGVVVYGDAMWCAVRFGNSKKMQKKNHSNSSCQV